MQLDKSSLTRPNLKSKQLEGLIRLHSKTVVYPARKIFLEPGMVLKGIYYIADGRTKHYMVGLDGTEKILYTLSSGWFYGETPNSLREPTGLFSQAEEKTEICIIPQAEYEWLLDTNKAFRNAILESCANKMLIMRHEIENLSFNSSKDRLKRFFCATVDVTNLQEGKWYPVKVHYTQYELSTIVGAARVTISKLMNELCDEGFIRLLNRNVQVNKTEYEKMIQE